MATLADWVEGARPRTLAAAFSPVVGGSAVAWFENGFVPVLAAGALVVALALQLGVNYANDYSDGIRGTDSARVGPPRLVGSGVAPPGQVKAAALISFAVAAVAGLGVVLHTGHWWLLGIGATAIAAAWLYTGGPRPYGYFGLGEVSVFLFFGLVAVAGTIYIQLGHVPVAGWLTAVAIGALACAILVANNLRDLDGDHLVGKRTLATRLGDCGTRRFFVGLVLLAGAGVVGVAATSSWWALLGLFMSLAAAGPVSAVVAGARGHALIAVLKGVGRAELTCALGLLAGLVIAR